MNYEYGGDAPKSDRLSRQDEAIRAEADEAREIGQRYDTYADEFETLLVAEEIPRGDSLAREIRHLFESKGDIKDPGSVDGDFVRRLGYDVCIQPDLIEACIRIAKVNSKEELISAEEIIKAWDHIESEYDASVDTKKGADILLAHGVQPHDVVELAIENPRMVRSYARLLDAPILVNYSKRLAQRFLEKGEVLPLQTVIGGAMGLIRIHNERQARIDAGDPGAIKEQNLLLRSSKFAEAIGEALLREEHDIDPGSHE